jgi:hypothetical protein
MLTVGVNAHKRTNMAVVFDAAGREVARWRGANSGAGWQEVAAWATALGPEIRWGIEGAWNNGRGRAQFLVEAGATVDEVNARWTAAGRRPRRPGHRARGLPRGGRAAARGARRRDGRPGSAGLRDGIVPEATRLRNQLHQLLLHLDPDYRTRIPSVKSQRGLRSLATYATADTRPL